jgi:DNA-binding NarL/FixJ family response regulator
MAAERLAVARTFIALDNRVLREALAHLLRHGGKDCAEVCGISGCIPQLAEMIFAAKADLLITEPSLSALAETGLLRQVMRLVPNIRILIIDMHEDEATFVEAVRAGAIGFLLRDCSTVDVLEAVQALGRNEAFCPPRLCLALLNHVARERLPLPSIQVKLQLGLTLRQQQIVPLIAKGLTNKEIATHLNLSEQTVKNHVHSMLQRTGAKDRLTVVDLARTTQYSPTN